MKCNVSVETKCTIDSRYLINVAYILFSQLILPTLLSENFELPVIIFNIQNYTLNQN